MAVLMQDLRNVKGLVAEQMSKLGAFKKYELLTEEDIIELIELCRDEVIGSYVKSMLYDNELDIPEIKELINALNDKRVFRYYLDGEKYYIALPEKREITDGVLNHMNSMLLKVGKAYYEYDNCPIEEKETRLELFLNLRHKLVLMIESAVFSKEFKNMYRMNFKGITGVALTGNVSIDGIEIPEWYARQNNISLGDIGIVFRDPVQNLIISLKVEGFTYNEMRVHSKIFTWLGGDHDGDKVQFIPLNNFLKENIEFTGRYTLDIVEEVINLLPSKLLEHGKYLTLLDGADLDVTPKRALDTPHSMLDMLTSSEKSMKYSGAINEEDYLDNQTSTVLNMRTVKEGTAFAGAFANWIFEKARVHGYDLVTARHLGDLVQQEALDSKHTTGGKGFMDSQWYKLVDLKNKCYRDSYDTILNKINNIMDGKEIENKLDENDEFEW